MEFFERPVETGPQSHVSRVTNLLEHGSQRSIPLSARIGPTELRRRFWHMAPGIIPLLLWNIPHRDPAAPLLIFIAGGVAAVLGVSIFVCFGMIARDRNQSDRMGAVVGYAGSVLATILLFPGQMELGMTTLAVLAFGDGSATLGGMLLQGRKLPWNPRKTWSGLFCFIAVGVPVASIIYWGETHYNPLALGPSIPFRTGLICGGAAVLVAAIAESLPLRINDNIRVGVSAAVTLVVAHGLTVGWS